MANDTATKIALEINSKDTTIVLEIDSKAAHIWEMAKSEILEKGSGTR